MIVVRYDESCPPPGDLRSILKEVTEYLPDVKVVHVSGSKKEAIF